MNIEIDAIIRYETGDLSDQETIDLFSQLVTTGYAWTLQGHYGRTAMAMIEAGILSQDGEILKYAEEMDR